MTDVLEGQQEIFPFAIEAGLGWIVIATKEPDIGVSMMRRERLRDLHEDNLVATPRPCRECKVHLVDVSPVAWPIVYYHKEQRERKGRSQLRNDDN